jgi:hypothetical protein
MIALAEDLVGVKDGGWREMKEGDWRKGLVAGLIRGRSLVDNGWIAEHLRMAPAAQRAGPARFPGNPSRGIETAQHASVGFPASATARRNPQLVSRLHQSMETTRINIRQLHDKTIFEVTPDKRVVWQVDSGIIPNAAQCQVLTRDLKPRGDVRLR